MLNIGIIGAGGVGSTAAFALIMRGVARKVVLIDQNAKRAEAEAEDIAHATPFAYANKIKAGTYKDLENTDVVIITAGANQKPGEPRNDLLATNVKIFESIIPQLAEHAPNAILVIASNPMDVMTSVAIKLSGFPENRVFGSGTVLDTARFRTLLGYHLGVSPKSLHANVLGEHGDSEVLIWSNAVAGTGMPAPNIAVKLLRQSAGGEWTEIADGITDSNGRIADFLPSDQNNSGIFKLRFATSDYFARQKQNSVYPYIEVVFKIENNDRHYHIPITVSANGYSTYLGN